MEELCIWLVPHDLLSLPFYTSPNHLPRVALPIVDCAYLDQPSVKKLSHGLTFRPFWWGYFLHQVFFLSHNSEFYQAKKIKRTNLINTGPSCWYLNMSLKIHPSTLRSLSLTWLLISSSNNADFLPILPGWEFLVLYVAFKCSSQMPCWWLQSELGILCLKRSCTWSMELITVHVFSVC